jgi:regulator of cell morphogenesis and NO signaling
VREACAARGIDERQLIAEIDAEERGPEESNPADLSPAELTLYIERRYHAALRKEVPRLFEMASRVEKVHAEKASCPQGLAAHLAAMHTAILQHLEKEEQVLFPMIRAGRGHLATMPVRVMQQEHLEHAENLKILRRLTGDHQVPAEACATWRALYQGLNDFELELMEHIHLENNVLFPRALG